MAYARFRDFDGVTRIVERTAATGARAETQLREALVDRAKTQGDEITPATRLKVVAEQWFADEIKDRKAYNTERRYREVLDLMVLPGLGMVTLRELTVARCDRFLKDVIKSHGPSAAKHARTVLSGVVGLATRIGALPRTRSETSPPSASRRRKYRRYPSTRSSACGSASTLTRKP